MMPRNITQYTWDKLIQASVHSLNDNEYYIGSFSDKNLTNRLLQEENIHKHAFNPEVTKATKDSITIEFNFMFIKNF